jgi:type IV conjugative transfer system coupling protein TraD
MLKTSSARNFTRGGQTLLHVLRMMTQIINRVAFACIIFFVVYVLVVGYLKIPQYDKYVLGQLGAAKVFVFFDSNSKQQFRLKNGEEIKVYSKDLCGSVLVDNVIKQTRRTLIYTIIQGVAFTILLFYISYLYLYYRGKKQGETQHIRGDEFQDAKTVAGMIKKQGASSIVIANLPMPKNFECGHIFLHGTTGTGKSVCIKELLDQIRARGEKAIIYDKGCDFTKYYCREEDILLNPLDERTVSWHLWDECRDDADYDSLAAALIPMPSNNADPFWIDAARTIFATTARIMAKDNRRSMSFFLQTILSDDLVSLNRYLKGTEAASLVSDKIEKTALSIKSVLITYLRSLKYVKDYTEGKKEAFSIRKWIRDDSQTNWLFISSLADKHESLKPLISMWLDLVANSLMSLKPSRSRRIWIIIDELPSLHKLPYLTEAFAESRKFGGCLVAGLQSISQLKKIYGQNAAEENIEPVWN